MNDTNLHDDDFFEQAQAQHKRMAFVGFGFFIFVILLISVIAYFFLAAAGVVPPVDVIPGLPYV